MKDCFTNFFSKLRYFLLEKARAIRNAFGRANFRHIETHWVLSRRANWYNPSTKTTVFSWSDEWRIAKNDCYYHGFESKESAKKEAFILYLKESKKRKDRYCELFPDSSFLANLEED